MREAEVQSVVERGMWAGETFYNSEIRGWREVPVRDAEDMIGVSRNLMVLAVYISVR